MKNGVRNFKISMTANEKGKLLAVCYVIAMGVIFFGFSKLFPSLDGLLNGWFLIAQMVVVLAYNVFYLVPLIVKRYLTMHEVESNLKRFVPFLQEYEIFPPVVAKVTLWGMILVSSLLLVGILPILQINFLTPVVESVFGVSSAMNYSFYLILIGIVIYAVLSIVRGVGYIEVKRASDRIYRQNFGKIPASLFEKCMLLFYFVPVLRVLPLVILNERLRKMVDIHELNLEEQEEFVETSLV